MNSNTITTSLVLAIGFVMAVVIGTLVVTDQIVALAWVGGLAVLTICFILGKNIWLLIPFSFYLKLDFPWLPGRFPPGHIAVLLAAVWLAMLIALRRVPMKIRITSVEWVAGLVILCVGQVYLRHPVGLRSLGSASIGARPYFDLCIAILGFLILSSIIVEPKKVRSAMNAMLIGGCVSVGIKALSLVWTPFGMIAARYVGAFGSTEQTAQFTGKQGDPLDTGAAGRNYALQEFATWGSRYLVSKLNPLVSLVRPLWLVAILSVAVAAAFSGYRNMVVVVTLNMMVAAFYWGRAQSVAILGALAVLSLVFLAILNQVAPLPPNVQRALSFLPGTWEERYILDARGSTEWRVEMWKEALFTDRYIDNKFFGDGLGFKASEYHGLMALRELAGNYHGGFSGLDLHRESAMLAGDYHSGPISFVRTIGYFGLFIGLIAMAVLVVQAHRLIVRARGTEWFGLVCFFCIPVIWWPLFFVFIGGAFNQDAPLIFLHGGFLRLLQNNLPLPELRRVPGASVLPLGTRDRVSA